MEDNHIENPYGNGCVSEVEDGREETDAEHVDHFAMQPSGVMEDFAVKHAVEDIAQGTRSNQRETEQHAELRVFLGDAEQDDEERNDRHNAENTQEGFCNAAATHPAEGHAVILHEKQFEHIAQQRDFLANGHMRLYPDFQNLVNQ